MVDDDRFEKLVRRAEEQLREQFAVYDEIRNGLGFAARDEQVAQHITELQAARAASRVAAKGFAHQQMPLVEFGLLVAFNNGLSPEAEQTPSKDPYIALLRDFLEQAPSDATVFDALSLHASEYVSDGIAMPNEIRRFIAARLRGHLKRPSEKGAPRNARLIHALIYPLIIELVEQHDLKPTHNEAEENGTSACAVISKAMKNLGLLPQSYEAIKRLYLKENAIQGDGF
ncbi:hypothetical protein EV663_12712 [Rhodovulum bhavnagarense]|uniref:Uncharacterized protein n=1 Tax=Rhodovulum bhavnagarense TaxID=992286 RepID=A0A4R2R5Z6_9RHOB|nr:hypothetical protein [Rhodovulum bhavnagarense]TCP58430.1 hypothetical protein EV663_12712 [Rhodovulum bhavnagarense]